MSKPSIRRQPKTTGKGIPANSTANPKPTFKFGDKIGEYLINGFAGVGATSYVYRARHETSFEHVAIKVLHPHLLSDKIKRTRFIREAQMMMDFDHPNVVSFHRILDEADNLAFVMQYIEGVTLEEWLKQNKGKAEQEEVLSIFVDLLRGLNHAHRCGIIHRDLKPANILISKLDDENRSCATIIDFGVARFADLPIPAEDRKKIVGTAAYISPEEVRDPETVCAASDIYSIGVMLYEAICGVRPFEGLGVRELMKAHVNSEPLRPSEVNPELNARLEGVILKTLEKTPDQRFQNVTELIDAIECATRAEVFKSRTAIWDTGRGLEPTDGASGFFRQALATASSLFFGRRTSSPMIEKLDDLSL